MASYTQLKKLISGNSSTKQLGEVVTWKPEPKNNKNKGKKTAKNAKGKGKRHAQDAEGEETIAASLYTPEAILMERNPQYYADIEKNYGLCVCDVVKGDSNKHKLPEEAKSRVRLSGKMHPTCSDFYPITSINKVVWNPNIGRFFWLATGHQSGIIRIIGMHFMQNETLNEFLIQASETLR